MRESPTFRGTANVGFGSNGDIRRQCPFGLLLGVKRTSKGGLSKFAGSMSAFGGKADSLAQAPGDPLIARSGHSQASYLSNPGTSTDRDMCLPSQGVSL